MAVWAYRNQIFPWVYQMAFLLVPERIYMVNVNEVIPYLAVAFPKIYIAAGARQAPI
ncbi:MAG: hypothetical protein AAF092_13220 [Pseudomonadota bacterium]